MAFIHFCIITSAIGALLGVFYEDWTSFHCFIISLKESLISSGTYLSAK